MTMYEPNTTTPFQPERVCPWCGADLDPDGPYDPAMEAHATECAVYLAEQEPTSCDCLPAPTEQDAHGVLHQPDCPLYRNPNEE